MTQQWLPPRHGPTPWVLPLLRSSPLQLASQCCGVAVDDEWSCAMPVGIVISSSVNNFCDTSLPRLFVRLVVPLTSFKVSVPVPDSLSVRRHKPSYESMQSAATVSKAPSGLGCARGPLAVHMRRRVLVASAYARSSACECSLAAYPSARSLRKARGETGPGDALSRSRASANASGAPP